MLYATYVTYTAHTLGWWAYFRLWWANDFFPSSFCVSLCGVYVNAATLHYLASRPKSCSTKFECFSLKSALSLFPSLSLPPSPPVERLSAMHAYLPITKINIHF